jgi:hypothetical protein
VLRLGDIDQAKAKGLGKRGKQAMNRHFQERGGRGMYIAGETLIPRETPMRTLSSGLSLWRFAGLLLLPLKRLRRKKNGL